MYQSVITLTDLIVMGAFFVGNFFYSVTKKSLPISIPLLKSVLGATNIDLGRISTEFSLSYGVSKLAGGILSDMLPPSLLFALGLFLGSVANCAITGVSDIRTVGTLWMLNGMGQGIGLGRHIKRTTHGAAGGELERGCDR